MNIDTEGALPLDVSSFIGHMTALLGITGSGKTNTAAVLIEELLSHNLPMTIVDIEGEYYGLKEKYELLVAGRSEHSELLLNPENAGALAQMSLERGISVILDLSEYTEDESYVCLVEYFTTLWNTASKVKRPYQVILEEAHEWIPEGARTPLKALLTRIALRGRKRGLGIVLMSQRSAKVAKDVLTQASLLFLHKVVHPTDMRVYKDLIPLPVADVEQVVGSLYPGQVVVVSNHVPQVAQIRLRHTFHAGSTPMLGGIEQPELRQIDATLLQELQKMITTSSPIVNDEKRLEKRIKDLEALLVEKNVEIAKRDEQIVLLSKLSVQMNGSSPRTLAVDQATVNHLHTPAVIAKQDTIQRVVESTVATRVVGSFMPVNETKFNSLVERFHRLPTLEQDILRVLIVQNKHLSSSEIAAWLNKAESTVRNHPPHNLLKMKVVARSPNGNRGYHYWSILDEYLAKEFPDTDTQQLQSRLLQH